MVRIMDNKPLVCVVMSTYNGEKYLKAQLESIVNQIQVRLVIYIRDDGSSDNTKEIIQEFEARNNIILECGENVGVKTSFLMALQKAPIADYYAFSDQDDVWDKDKLITAIELLQSKESCNVPILYCGRTRLVNSDLTFIQEGRRFREKPFKFLCGEVQAAAGCTMVFTRNLKVEIERYFPVVYPMHDSWVSNLCLALGGNIIYDNNCYINYRQHNNNAVGGSKNLISSIKRRIVFYKTMGANYHIKMYQEIMDAYEMQMPKENITRCKMVCSYHDSVKAKIGLLTDKCFWHGRIKGKIETLILILLNQY